MERISLRRLCLGLTVIAIGVVYLLLNVGILPIEFKPILISWKMLLIVVGVAQLYNRHFIGGIICVIIGVIFMMPDLSVIIGFSYSAAMLHNIGWPSLLIILGIMLVFRRGRKINHGCESAGVGHCMHSTRKHRADGGIDYNVIMNGIDEIFLEPVFRGGEINSIMGGVKLDLRRTSLPEGTTTIEIDSICGGVDLLVPSDWYVEVFSDCFLGGFSDKRCGNGFYSDRKLVVRAHFIMGGGEIR